MATLKNDKILGSSGLVINSEDTSLAMFVGLTVHENHQRRGLAPRHSGFFWSQNGHFWGSGKVKNVIIFGQI